MTTHPFTYNGDASKLRTWLVPVDPPPEKWAVRAVPCGSWRVRFESNRPYIFNHRETPFKDGDVCEFRPPCVVCKNQATHRRFDKLPYNDPLCDDCCQDHDMPLDPVRRTIRKVTPMPHGSLSPSFSPKSSSVMCWCGWHEQYPNLSAIGDRWLWVLVLEK